MEGDYHGYVGSGSLGSSGNGYSISPAAWPVRSPSGTSSTKTRLPPLPPAMPMTNGHHPINIHGKPVAAHLYSQQMHATALSPGARGQLSFEEYHADIDFSQEADDEIEEEEDRGGGYQHQEMDSDDELIARGVLDHMTNQTQVSHDETPDPRLREDTDRYGFLPGSKEYTDPETEERIPIKKLKARELKWLEMLTNWDKWMQKKYKKIRDRCRKGILSSLRARAWQLLSGSRLKLMEQKGLYERLLQTVCDPQVETQITLDLNRQFGAHELIMTRSGQEDLYRVLRAYAVYHKEDGYCQAHAPIACMLLMHMPEEDAFWTMHCLCEKYLKGYYAEGLEKVRVDGFVLYGLLKRVYPAVYKYLRKNNVGPDFVVPWFMCLFTRNLPWPTVLRVWDMFFCEGIKVIFRCAIVLVRAVVGLAQQQRDLDVFEYLQTTFRSSLPPQITTQSFLIEESLRLPLSPQAMEEEHNKQLRRYKEDVAKQSQRLQQPASQPSSGKSGRKKTKAVSNR